MASNESAFEPYSSFSELLARCEQSGKSIADLAIEHETAQTGQPRAAVLNRMAQLVAQMKTTIDRGIATSEPSVSGLTGGNAQKLIGLLQQPHTVMSPLVVRMMAYGLATLEENSRMRTIVACPTAGGSGSVPAVLIALEDELGIAREQSVLGLVTAGAIGELVARRMHLSGAAAGCQAEVGVACGMAAGAMVSVLNGTPAQVLDAAALSMQNLMGLVCDPVAGLVEVPCVVRNGLSSVQAASAATMALAGVCSFVPLDEVVDAMAEVGRAMPAKYKETAQGGLAQTPTGRQFMQQLYGNTPTT